MGAPNAVVGTWDPNTLPIIFSDTRLYLNQNRNVNVQSAYQRIQLQDGVRIAKLIYVNHV
jgi:hypothetical protein